MGTLEDVCESEDMQWEIRDRQTDKTRRRERIKRPWFVLMIYSQLIDLDVTRCCLQICAPPLSETRVFPGCYRDPSSTNTRIAAETRPTIRGKKSQKSSVAACLHRPCLEQWQNNGSDRPWPGIEKTAKNIEDQHMQSDAEPPTVATRRAESLGEAPPLHILVALGRHGMTDALGPDAFQLGAQDIRRPFADRAVGEDLIRGGVVAEDPSPVGEGRVEGGCVNNIVG